MGAVVDMTGRVLDPGETVTETLSDQAVAAKYREVWDSVPDLVREIAEREGLFYPDVVETVVHSLLQEAVEASETHDAARGVLEFIERCFFAPAGDDDSSESS